MVALGLAFLGEPAVPEMVKLAQYAERLRYDSVWVAETRFTRDSLIPAAAIAQATDSITIGTGVINPYTREPAVQALSFISLNEIAEGRIVAGLGPGSPNILKAQGIPFTSPLPRLQENVTVLRMLLQEGTADFAGDHIRVDGVNVEVPTPRTPIPVFLGVTGKRALELAGRIADGVIFNGFLPQAYYRRAWRAIARGRAYRQQGNENFCAAGFVVTSVDTDPSVARDRIRPLIATYLLTFPNIARETGYPQQLMGELRHSHSRGGPDAAAKLIDDHWVDALTLTGTPDECHKKVARYRESGIGLPILAPVTNFELALETFAQSGAP